MTNCRLFFFTLCILGNITGSSRSIFGCFTNSNLELEFHVWRISRPTNWKVKHWILRSTKPASAPTHTREAEFSFSWPPRALKIEFNKLKKYSTTYNDTHTLTKLQIGQGGGGCGGCWGNSLVPFSHFNLTNTHTHTHRSCLSFLISHFPTLILISHSDASSKTSALQSAIRGMMWDYAKREQIPAQFFRIVPTSSSCVANILIPSSAFVLRLVAIR